MRATESNDTILDHAFVADADVALVCPAGFAGAGLFQVAVFAWALLGFAHVYSGIADRAFDLAVQGAHRRRSIALTRSMAYHPEVRHQVADMRITLDGVDALLRRVGLPRRPGDVVAFPLNVRRTADASPDTPPSRRRPAGRRSARAPLA